ncbi:MAG: 5-oxoprolinase subunit PxpA [Candidatus Bathyarchaeota archaeon]|nr:5-oxoprolinase subunit PxpA [Candidatus Bathyarchaeota archaeon]MDH5495145.1 5-oxoprolinase subunit PxpA [Candidatus Bathyarchaeota archaeon]
MKLKIDINCDLGESFGNFKVGHDAEIMPFITSANIACGFHAGDPAVMARTVKLAKEHKVAIGAHPGFPDLMGFGRRDMSLSKEEVKNIVVYQVGALEAFTKAADTHLQHVKPHGALYNTAAKNEAYANAIIEAVDAINPKLVLFALANSKIAKMATEAGLRVASEVFVDRAYNPDGSLVSRNGAGAVIEDAKLAAERTVSMIKEKRVTAIDSQTVKFDEVHTICVHGDTLNSVELAKAVKKALLAADVQVMPIGTFI